MSISLRDINKENINNLYNELLPTFNKIHERYTFLNLEDNEFKSLVLDELTNSIVNYDKNEKFDIYIKRAVEKRINEKINELLTNESYAFDTINRYIELNFKQSRQYEKALNNLQQLSYFLSKYDCDPNVDLLVELITKNKVLSQNISIIVKHDINDIKKADIKSNYDENLICTIIESYCLKNNIEINDNLDISDLPLLDIEDKNLKLKDDLKQYLSEISKIPLLTLEQEKELSLRVSKGDKKAEKAFIEHNLRLVVSVAYRYYYGSFTGNAHNLLDLIQDGNLGLMKAVKEFDGTKGYKFSTYAYYWIRQAIMRGINNKSRSIRIPVWQYEKLINYNRKISKLENELNRKLTDKEISNHLKITINEVIELKQFRAGTISLNTKIDNNSDNDAEFGDFIPSPEESPEEKSIETNFKEQVQKIFEVCNLKEQEILVLKCRFGFNDGKPMTLEETGKVLGTTRERARQIEKWALIKIRRSSYIKKLAELTENPKDSLNKIKSIKENDYSYVEKLGESARKVKLKQKKQSSIQQLNANKSKTIYEYFSSSKEAVDLALGNLCQNHKDLLVRKYGEDLENPQEGLLIDDYDKNIFYKKILPKLRNLLGETKEISEEKEMLSAEKHKNDRYKEKLSSEEKSKLTKRVKVIIEYEKVNSSESMKEILNNSDLTDKEIEVIKYRFGLDNHYSKTLEEIGKIYGLTRAGARRIEQKALLKLSNNPYINKLLFKENVDEIRVISNKDDEVLSIEQKGLTEIKEKLLPIINKTTNNDNLNDSSPKFIETSKFTNILKDLPAKEMIVVSLRLGFIEDKSFSTESISSFLEISEEDVRDITVNVLTKYKEKMCSEIDNVINDVKVKTKIDLNNN